MYRGKQYTSAPKSLLRGTGMNNISRKPVSVVCWFLPARKTILFLLLFGFILTNLRLYGHFELEFAGVRSKFYIPQSNSVLISFNLERLDTTAQNKDPLQLTALRTAKGKYPSQDMSNSATQQHLKYRPGQLIFFDEPALGRDRQLFLVKDPQLAPIVKDLVRLAKNAMVEKAWTVMDKPDMSVAPSGDKHDFFALSDSFHPLHGEGVHLFGTSLHEAGSEKYDVSRLKDFQYITSILGVAYAVTKSEKYSKKAAEFIRVFFLNKETRMNPNMNYGHETPGLNQTFVSPHSINLMGELYLILDTVRIVNDAFDPDARTMLQEWFSEYLGWLDNTVSVQDDAVSRFVHGPYFDIQRIAIASYLNDTSKVQQYVDKASARMLAQIDVHGNMPHKFKTNNCEQNLISTLQGWSIVSRMATSIMNRNLWTEHTINGTSLLCRASKKIIPYYGRAKKCNRHPFKVPAQTWWPLVYESQQHCSELKGKATHVPKWLPAGGKSSKVPLPPQSVYDMPSLYGSEYGIAPFWQLGKRFTIFKNTK